MGFKSVGCGAIFVMCVACWGRANDHAGDLAADGLAGARVTSVSTSLGVGADDARLGNDSDPLSAPPSSPTRQADFNAYILQSVELNYRQHRAQGYVVGGFFTHSLDYERQGDIVASKHAPGTMCVAAVSEVIIDALRMYVDETGDRSVFARLPTRSWIKTAAKDIRSYIFMLDNVDSNGTADALERFGIGKQVPFGELVPGDFVGLNRSNGSGHAVVFLGFLDSKGRILQRFDRVSVVGFKYFSSQGKNRPDSGFGYRWGFFGECPEWHEADKPRDCGIVRSDRQQTLNTGYMLHPREWRAEDAMTALRKQRHSAIMTRRLAGRAPAVEDFARLAPAERQGLEDQAERDLSTEAPSAVTRMRFDGSTTDD